MESLVDQRELGATGIVDWYEQDIGLTPNDMVVYQNPDELELDDLTALVPQRQYNPRNAILFADGRIGIIPSTVVFNPLPDTGRQMYYPTYIPIFVNQDGTWMLDETLPICLGDCDTMPTPALPGGGIQESSMATPAN